MQYAKELVTAALQKSDTLGKLAASVTGGVVPSTAGLRSGSNSGGDGHHAPSSSQLSISAGPAVEARVHRFKQELAASHINVHALKRLAFHGIPDRDGLRITVWKVLLGYLPRSPDEWKQALARRRTQYHVFCNELIVDPKRPMQEDGTLHTAPSHDADPLTPSASAGPRPSTAGRADSSAQQGASHDPLGDPLGGPASGSPPTQQDGTAHASTSGRDGQQAGASPSSAAASAGASAPVARVSSSPFKHPQSAASASASNGGLASVSQQQEERSRREQEEAAAEAAASDPLFVRDVTTDDHPLSLDVGSRWRTFFQDNETLEQITRDVMRTHPDMEFFTGESEEAELHRQEMRRALFMYAKLNPGLRYIQGMNELIAPLYYLFKHDRDEREAEFAEADAFWCFLELISEFRDHFCAQLDNAQTGIRATLRRLMQLLQQCDYPLWQHIEVTSKVDPQYYAFRWITLLLSQEFPFDDTLRIWDTILSDPHGRMDCLLRICAAMVMHVKPRLMQGDFTVIMKTLQRFPQPVDIPKLLEAASQLPTLAEAGIVV